MALAVGFALTGQSRPLAVRVMFPIPSGPVHPENEIEVIWPSGAVPVLVGTIVAVEAEQAITSPDLVSVNCGVPAEDQVTEADAGPVQAIADAAAMMAPAMAIRLSRLLMAASRVLRFRARTLPPVSSRPLSARCHRDAGGPARLPSRGNPARYGRQPDR